MALRHGTSGWLRGRSVAVGRIHCVENPIKIGQVVFFDPSLRIGRVVSADALDGDSSASEADPG